MNEYEFSENDIKGFKERGFSKEAVSEQIKKLLKGTLTLNLIKPCLAGKGINVLDDKNKKHYSNIFKSVKKNNKIVKFIPASGAASRMFKDLIYGGSLDNKIEDYEGKGEHADQQIKIIRTFLKRIKEFPFYPALRHFLKAKGENIDELLENKKYEYILNTLLNEEGLNLKKMPKALIPFHLKADRSVSAFEEQINESLGFSTEMDGKSHFEFTILKEHYGYFEKLLTEINEKIKKNETSAQVTFSFQEEKTDTVSLFENGRLARKKSGEVLFRPGGHGSLINNLNKLAKKYDLIFIKNIDNISTEKYQKDTDFYFSVLGGYLSSFQERIFSCLRKLNSNKCSEKDLDGITDFCVSSSLLIFEQKFYELGLEEKTQFLINRLNRPLRICGMVENEKETGGLPFWVQDDNSDVTLQIVEGAQIKGGSKSKDELIKESEFFNPVFMVLSVKDFNNKPFNLLKYINDNTCIITEKTFEGEAIKVLENPGLWNGGMYYWNTVFVEVPRSVFAPVKTVMDLLGPQHKG